MSTGYRCFPACCRRLPVSLGCTPLRQPRSYAFMVRHGCHRQPLPHLPISADGAPACGTRPKTRERREAYPVPSVPVPCTGGGTFPCVRPDNMSGTDVARYLHAGDEAARCRRDPGGQRFVPSGPHPHRADAGCANRHATFFVILRRIQQWKNGLIPLSTCRTSWPRCRPRILSTP